MNQCKVCHNESELTFGYCRLCLDCVTHDLPCPECEAIRPQVSTAKEHGNFHGWYGCTFCKNEHIITAQMVLDSRYKHLERLANAAA
jgi:hypothetical protein